MNPHERLTDIHALEEELLSFERKYGIRSETFYAAYVAGEEAENDDWALDFSEWASVYRTLLEHQAKTGGAPYQWRREDAYEERFARYGEGPGLEATNSG